MFGLADEFIGQILVLLLLIPVIFRPLFKKRKYADSVVMLSPLSFVLSLLLIGIYGLSYTQLVTAVPALLVLLTNIRAVQRFNNRLYVDRYSLAFRIAAFFEAVLILFALVVLFLFRSAPVPIKPVKTLFTGSFNRGFIEKRELFRPVNAITFFYAPQNFGSRQATENKVLAVFLPDIKTVAEDSALRLSAVAQMGTAVFTGDFYEPNPLTNGRNMFFFNRFYTKAFCVHRLNKNAQLFNEIKADLLRQKKAELEALLAEAGKYAFSVVIVTEGDALSCAKELHEKYPLFVRGIFDAAALRPAVFSPAASAADNVSRQTKPKSFQTAIDYYSAGTADLLLIKPFDALPILYNGLPDIGTFFDSWRRAKIHSAHTHFARELQAYMEGL